MDKLQGWKVMGGFPVLQFIAFAVIYGIMIFIWSFVYLNKSADKVNQAFLAFLGVVILWMVLSVSSGHGSNSAFGFVVKTIYWYSMMNISLFFLLFVYRFLKKKLGPVFYSIAAVNTLTIASRYLFPIDYSNPTFWRLSIPVIAPAMSAIFSFPVVYALFLVIRQYRNTNNLRQKAQLRFMFVGFSLACLTSVVSEYALPVLFHKDTDLILMYVAILIFIVFIFISIMKHKLLNMQSEYMYRKLFLSSNDGIIMINKNYRIISANDAAKEILQDENMDSGDKITDYIKDYDFKTNYKQHEVTIKQGSGETYLSITQHPIDPTDKDSAKLMTVMDITTTKLRLKQEKDMLIIKSSIDNLTGLYNKQYFIDNYYSVKQEPAGAQMALLFIDIDDFKSINDLHGHIAGDKVLKSVAACIKETIGQNAKAIRFGGDEFVVILEKTTESEAYTIAENIRKKANTLNFSHCDEDLRITLSIGLIVDTAPVKELVLKADMVMYESKSSGKNRTTVFTEQN